MKTKGGFIIERKKSRKYQLTINNPLDKGMTHDEINGIMQKHPYVYYCLCDEIGESQTPHTHIYVCFENAVYFETLKKRFPQAHIEKALGSSQENRDYIRKEGKYENSEKKETNIIETFEEYGKMPLDKATKNEKVTEQVLNMVKDGCSIAEIIMTFPSFSIKIPQIEQMRQTLIEDNVKDVWRTLEVVYIYGDTATGKTRYVMEKHGYSNVYKITNYKNPFDGYRNEDVILFDEFRDSLPLKDMLQYLDGYPCRLPARYTDRYACFTKVYMVSNIPLDEQFISIQNTEVTTWNAFVRRITKMLRFERNGLIIDEVPECYIK